MASRLPSGAAVAAPLLNVPPSDSGAGLVCESRRDGGRASVRTVLWREADAPVGGLAGGGGAAAGVGGVGAIGGAVLAGAVPGLNQVLEAGEERLSVLGALHRDDARVCDVSWEGVGADRGFSLTDASGGASAGHVPDADRDERDHEEAGQQGAPTHTLHFLLHLFWVWSVHEAVSSAPSGCGRLRG